MKKRRTKSEQLEMVSRISELRELGWSQERIARKLGDINRDMVGHYCRLYQLPTEKIVKPAPMDFSNKAYSEDL